MIKVISLIGFCLSVAFVSFAQQDNSSVRQGTFTDERDGQVYSWVQIGSQVWMAENLNFGKGSLNCYKGRNHNCDTYGRLYPMKKARKACPSGWHLPDDSEWVTLTDYLGGEGIAGGKMKQAGTAYWESPNASATNLSGFNAIPGGLIDRSGISMKIGIACYFWSSSESDLFHNWTRAIKNGEGSVQRNQVNWKFLLSVRCIKDN